MTGILLMTLAILGMSFLFWPPKKIRKFKRGEISLIPSEGEAYIYLGFCPKEIVVYLVGDEPDSPSCVELDDAVNNVQPLHDGFKFDFKIESGIRTIKWTARRQ